MNKMPTSSAFLITQQKKSFMRDDDDDYRIRLKKHKKHLIGRHNVRLDQSNRFQNEEQDLNYLSNLRRRSSERSISERRISNKIQKTHSVGGNNKAGQHTKRLDLEDIFHGPTESPLSQISPLQLSHAPSIAPTQSYASRHLCHKYNGYNFGLCSDDGDNNSVLMQYNYDIESDIAISNTMGDSFIDVTKKVEATLLEFLIEIYFSQCNITSSNHIGDGYGGENDGEIISRVRQRASENNILKSESIINDNINTTIVGINKNINNQSIINENNTLTGIVGMSSKPIDIVNQGEFRKCQI